MDRTIRAAAVWITCTNTHSTRRDGTRRCRPKVPYGRMSGIRRQACRSVRGVPSPSNKGTRPRFEPATCFQHVKATASPPSPSVPGAGTQNRTGDTRLLSPVLYQLSYSGTTRRPSGPQSALASREPAATASSASPLSSGSASSSSGCPSCFRPKPGQLQPLLHEVRESSGYCTRLVELPS